MDVDKFSEYLITTEKLGVNDHIAMQEIFQKYCNQSVSKTINLPNDYPFEDFKDLYMTGWKKGLIGLTTYRDGSMEAVLSRVENAKFENRVVVENVKLPDVFINGDTHKIRREGSKFYLNFSYLPNDIAKNWPIALFINCNSQYDSIVCNRSARALKELAIDSGIPEEVVIKQLEKCKDDQPHMKLSKMISLNLRHCVEIVRIVESLQGVEGDNISSLLTAVRKFLSSNIEDGTTVEGQKCDKCGAENSMIYSGGCVICKDCGFSGCN
jgi:ribonucleoside-diphosphate reductase alpha chain